MNGFRKLGGTCERFRRDSAFKFNVSPVGGGERNEQKEMGWPLYHTWPS